MLISHVSEADLQGALETVNRLYGGNVRWNNFEAVNKARTRWRVTLRVKDSKGPGHRLSYNLTSAGNQRRLPAACWHVHGEFFDALPKQAVIRLGAEGVHRPGDRWIDRNIGSQFRPLYFSEACECGSRAIRKGLMEGRVKSIPQSALTADCWGVQVWGLTACSQCSYKNTDECGGRAILKKIDEGLFPKTGIPDGG